jgi:hypothetical protein
MLFQVVHCYPLTDSYNHALFHTVVEALKPRHDVIATDLYRERFAPAMTGMNAAAITRAPMPRIRKYPSLLNSCVASMA